MAADAVLNGLKRQRPEWQPWLVVVEEILRETGNSTWDDVVPTTRRHSNGTHVPLLAGASLAVQESSVSRLLERLIQIASRRGTPKMAGLKAALDADVDVLALFAASLCHDSERVIDVATVSGVDPEALQAVVALLPVPLLQACARRSTSLVSKSWVQGYCPVCASWPTFAEMRGIERSRHFRCGRCGGEWHARALYCPYCDTIDHDDLVTLVPGKGGTNAVIDACKRCLGYIKTFTKLQGCPPDAVMVEDLASVDFDIAALEQGYARPAGTGYPLELTVTAAPVTASVKRRFLSWKS